MNIFILLSLPLLGLNLLAEDSPGPLPPPSLPLHTAVDLVYTSPASGQSTGPRMAVSTYKGEADRVVCRSWPSGRTTYSLTVKGWQFSTDPTAPESHKDFVTIVPANPKLSADFPELEFMSGNVTVVPSTLEGKAVRLVTAPPSEPQITEASIADQLKSIRDPSEKARVEKALREAQAQELKRQPPPPDRAWLDLATGLPLKAEVGGQVITYTYRTPSVAPVLPPFIIEAMKAKFGDSPPL